MTSTAMFEKLAERPQMGPLAEQIMFCVIAHDEDSCLPESFTCKWRKRMLNTSLLIKKISCLFLFALSWSETSFVPRWMEQLKICPSKIICIRYRSVSRTLRENCQEVGQLSLEGEHKSPSTTRFGGTLMIIFSLILMLVLCFKLRSFKP